MITLTREEAQELFDIVEAADRVFVTSAKHGGNPKKGHMTTLIKDYVDVSLGLLKQLEKIKLFRARLAQPEPEPVIKMKELLEVQGRDGNWNLDPYMQGMYNGMELMVALAEGRDPVFRKAPENWLSAPPQRNWQGLTDEEIWEVCGTLKVVNQYPKIEAKLKEKNSGR